MSRGLPESFPDPSATRTYQGVLELVGNTPLLRVGTLAAGLPGEVYLKLDYANAGGSSKDRIALNIVREAERSGELRPGDRIIDFGVGNTVIGLALAGIATGHPVTAVVNDQLSPTKEKLLRLLGVTLIPGRGDVPRADPESWQSIARRHADEDPATWWAHQVSNLSNPDAHYHSTGPEVWEQTQGRVTTFIAALATGGTASGGGRYLKERNRRIRVIGTAIEESPLVAKGLLEAFHSGTPNPEISENIDLELLDDIRTVPKAEVVELGWRAARTEGLLLGITSVLSLKVALELAAEASDGDVIVSFVADHGRDYLDQEYNPAWLRENGFGEIADTYT